jgi:N-carbamoyl-L-amino-acid hydrolase
VQNIKVNGERLWESLMEMAKIGATEKGGVCRLALTDVDKAARDLFVQWCEEAGCAVSVDTMGNIFARRAGKDDSLPPVMTGSHIDSQPTGGKFDGIYGVLAGLEVIRTLNDLGYETNAPIEVSAWTNEEGSRFAPAMIASGVFGGEFTLEEGLACKDVDGKTIGEELERIGYAGDVECGGREVGAFFEAHIEQGPILEAEEKTIGVVHGVQGIRWFDVNVTGMESHAGTTPMERRKDALVGAAELITEIHRIAMDNLPDSRSTVGMMDVSPNSRNVIPGSVFFSADLRHPDADVLDAMTAEAAKAAERIAAANKLEISFEEIWTSPPVKFADKCVGAVAKATEMLGLASRPITSGAGHDAVYVSRVAPTGMIFIPCEDGISHNEIEAAAPTDIAAGCDVLLNAMVEVANQGSDGSA